MKRIWLSVAALFLIFPHYARASDQINTSVVVNYVFDSDGRSRVTQNFTLTNRISGIYVSSYRFQIDGEILENIAAVDKTGSLKVTTDNPGPDTTSVNVSFSKPLAGLGQTRDFSLEYQGAPAVKNGHTWEIRLPKLASPDFADNYVLNLYLPDSFGSPINLSPVPVSAENLPQSRQNHYVFSKDQLSSSGVSGFFGSFQSYDFSLGYHLKNPKNIPFEYFIAIPPDLGNQKVFYDYLSPRPVFASVDSDGNWLAYYRLPPGSALDVRAGGQILLLEDSPFAASSSATTDLSNYLSSSSQWPTSDSQIKSLGMSLNTPAKIYGYVTSLLDYDYSLLNSADGGRRRSVNDILSLPKASICTDFSDLYITLARSAGIPSREIQGFAYSSDNRSEPVGVGSALLHSWVQYFDASSSAWVNIDPTWGKTTGRDYLTQFDFSHLAFVIHGHDAFSPIPPSDDINIHPNSRQIPPTRNYDVSVDIPFQLFPLVSPDIRLKITNTTGFSTPYLSISTPAGYVYLPGLIPYGVYTARVKAGFFFPPVLGPKYFTVTVNGQTVSYNIPNRYYIAWQLFQISCVAIILIILAAIAHYAWSISIYRRRR